MDFSLVIKIVFTFIFFITALLTLGGILNRPPFDRINDRYLKALFGALILELIGVMIFVGKEAFLPTNAAGIKNYKWTIQYPVDLRTRFEKLYVTDESFAAFYKKYQYISLGTIDDKPTPAPLHDKYVDQIFVLRKAEEFQNRKASGELFVRQNTRGQPYGKAILTFPKEIQPVAFDVSTGVASNGTWVVQFFQPDRFVEFQSRINKWIGGTLKVTFKKADRAWSGNLIFNDVNVGVFSLEER